MSQEYSYPPPCGCLKGASPVTDLTVSCKHGNKWTLAAEMLYWNPPPAVLSTKWPPSCGCTTGTLEYNTGVTICPHGNSWSMMDTTKR